MANDPYWNSGVLAMHMDDTGLTDLKGHTVTLNGNAARSSTQSKFGGYSAYFDGAGDYLSLASNTDFNYGTGDFTIEFWVYVPTWAEQVASSPRLLERGAYNAAVSSIVINFSKSNGYAIFSYGATSQYLAIGVLTENSWSHIAVSRASGVTKSFLNGSQVATATIANDFTNTATLTVGDAGASGAGFRGYIDDLRITKGVARYTANFSVPSAAFPDTPPQLSGTVKDSSGNFAARTVRVYRRDTGALVSSSTSSGVDGTFSANAYDGSAHFAVCFDDGTPDENAIILDNITPV